MSYYDDTAAGYNEAEFYATVNEDAHALIDSMLPDNDNDRHAVYQALWDIDPKYREHWAAIELLEGEGYHP